MNNFPPQDKNGKAVDAKAKPFFKKMTAGHPGDMMGHSNCTTCGKVMQGKGECADCQGKKNC